MSKNLVKKLVALLLCVWRRVISYKLVNFLQTQTGLQSLHCFYIGNIAV